MLFFVLFFKESERKPTQYMYLQAVLKILAVSKI